MEVIAVSCSQPQWIDINGIRTWSSIIHKPTTAIHLTEDGIEDNDLATHDAPVYVFFQHHYKYWRNRLDLPETAWDWCHWGENITLRTDMYLDESQVHIGDIWRIGADVLLQVCGARVPCYKLSWRCGQKDSWLMDLAKTGFCGLYMRVLRGGIIRPGDRGQITGQVPGPISVATITQLAFEDALKTKDTINLLVQDPGLLSMNKLLFLRKLSMLHDQELLHKDHWKGWRAFRPARIVDECKDVKSFYLEPVDKQSLGTYLPGQFATVRLPHGKTKTWTISDCVSHECPQHYRITIKKACENGTSAWMHKKCTTSTKLYMRAPTGAFHLDWSSMVPGRQVYLSAGIGITPMLAMLKAHLKHYTMSKAPAIWIHVGREEDSVPWNLMRETIDLYNSKDNAPLQAHIFLTSPNITSLSTDDTAVTTKIAQQDILTLYSGRPTPSSMQNLLSEPYTINPLNIKPISIPGVQSTFYICGPSTFETAMKSQLRALEVSDSLIRSESFSSSTTTTITTPSIAKAVVRFLPAQISADWTTAAGDGQSQSLLELAESMNLDPAYGCRAGACGACKARLVKGSVVGGVQTDGGVLLCSARPGSEVVEIEM